MESLIGYGSEDDLDESSNRKKTMFRQADVNYDEVQMDLSEDSSNSPRIGSHQHYPKGKDTNLHAKGETERYRRGSDDYKLKSDQERYEKSNRSDYKSGDKYRAKDDRNDNRNQRHKDDKGRDYKSDRNYDDKDRRRDERSREYRRWDSRDGENRYKDSKNHDSRESNNRDTKHYSRERDRDKTYDSRDNTNRTNKNYDSREGSSRDNRNSDSRDISKNDNRPRKFSSPSRHRSRSPAHSDSRARRSNSRDKNLPGYSSKFYERNTNKIDRLEKLGIEIGSQSERASTSNYEQSGDKELDKNRFFMPGITGRFTEQIQRRKLLWQKKEAKPVETTGYQPRSSGVPGKVWQNTTFAQDTDGKVANKFKRLMGMKGVGDNQPAKPATEILKKQEEMFSSMEAQYEVARTATHTMRGVGLGFSSFQR